MMCDLTALQERLMRLSKKHTDPDSNSVTRFLVPDILS